MRVDARIFGFDSWTAAVTETAAGTRENHRNRVVICTARRGIDPRWFNRGDRFEKSLGQKKSTSGGRCICVYVRCIVSITCLSTDRARP